MVDYDYDYEHEHDYEHDYEHEHEHDYEREHERLHAAGRASQAEGDVAQQSSGSGDVPLALSIENPGEPVRPDRARQPAPKTGMDSA